MSIKLFRFKWRRMKENWINKLIDLLNEYEEEKTDSTFKLHFWDAYWWHLSFLEYNSKYSDLLCISKRYEFIKRLVKNDKIDRHNVKETRFKNQIIDPEIWAWLFLIKEKYFKKVKQHKLDRKKIESHKAEKERMINARKQKEHNYQWHIKFCERACGEQKRLLLAIWMIAHNQKRMNEN